MTSKRETLFLLLLFMLLLSGILMAEYMYAGGADRTSASEGSGAASSARAQDTVSLQDPSAADTGAGAAAALPFTPKDVLWKGGMPACDAASCTVYVPWELPDEGALSEKNTVENRDEAAAEFRRTILEALVPAAPGGRIELYADDLQEDPAAAVQEGHAFPARLVTPEGTSQFQIVLTGLPVLSLQKTDAQEIAYKEKHEGLIRLLPPLSAGAGDRGAGAASEQTFRCSFHVRGNVSSTLEKKPYKISLKDTAGDQEKVTWLDLRRDDDWILNPLYTDSTRVREMTAYTLWDEASFFAGTPMPSSRMRYVELFIDNAWQGIYGLMEPVDRKQLGLSPGDLLYKIDRWNREYPYLDLYEGAERAQDLEICNDYGFPCVELRYPKSWDQTATWRPMQAFHEFSFRTYDSGTLENAQLVPDMDSVLSLSLFCAMTHAMDNNWKNSFLIASKHMPGEKNGNGNNENGNKENGNNGDGDTAGDGDLYEYDLYRTIWDMNYTFGDVFVYEPEKRYTAFDMDTASAFTPYEDSTCDFEAFLRSDAGTGEELQKALGRKWAAWRAGGISADRIISVAEGYFETLRRSGALAREMKGWPQDEDAQKAMEKMEVWIRSRFDFLDGRFSFRE
ncbi:MAG: CotH kinase family protein [Lachnospiraceae bacterium]|nr:CotH kinase family protein [Lachnospiraceae bacterium]